MEDNQQPTEGPPDSAKNAFLIREDWTGDIRITPIAHIVENPDYAPSVEEMYRVMKEATEELHELVLQNKIKNHLAEVLKNA